MSAVVIRLRKDAPSLGCSDAALREALIQVRGSIISRHHDYICCAASHLYTWRLREWLGEIMRDCGIRTDGAGFSIEFAPDWLLEISRGHSPTSDRVRRVHFLDCVIKALEQSSGGFEPRTF